MQALSCSPLLPMSDMIQGQKPWHMDKALGKLLCCMLQAFVRMPAFQKVIHNGYDVPVD